MISLWHRTLFVHIPKCGGQSVESAFLNDIGLDFKQHRWMFLCLARKGMFKHMRGPPKLAHLRAHEYVELGYVSGDLVNRLYKFSIVRDPFARVESFWRYRFAHVQFDEFVLSRLARMVKRRNWFYGSQYEFLHGPDGALLVDDVFKLEQIGAWWEIMQGKANLARPMQHVNASRPRKSSVWTEEMADLVRDLYARDFQAFGYSPATPASGT